MASNIQLVQAHDLWGPQGWKEPLVVVDYARTSVEFWLQHLPQAVYAPKAVAWTPVDGVEGMLPPQLKQTLERAGIPSGRSVLVYDQGNALYAARLALALSVAGYPKVYLLQGGLDGWKNLSLPIHRGPSLTKKSASPSSVPLPGAKLVASLTEVRNRAEDVVLLDTRSTKEYTGAEKRALHGGRIPGAIHWEWKKALLEDGLTFKSPEVLQKEFSTLGITKDSKVITYCQSGVRASHTLVALERAGITQVQVYDGSWTEWGNLQDTPKEVGV